MRGMTNLTAPPWVALKALAGPWPEESACLSNWGPKPVDGCSSAQSSHPGGALERSLTEQTVKYSRNCQAGWLLNFW